MLKERQSSNEHHIQESEVQAKEPQVLTPIEFLRDFQDQAQKAEKSIFIQSMHLEPGHAVNTFLYSLKLAAERGVEVDMRVDGYAQLVIDEAPVKFPVLSKTDREYRKFRISEQQKLFGDIKRSGGNVVNTNPAYGIDSLLVFRHRDHRKVFIIDDRITYLGGINLSDYTFNSYDFVVRFDDPLLANCVEATFADNSEISDYPVIIPVADESQLIMDSGTTGIYNHGHKMIQRAADRIVLSSQFTPNRETAFLLEQRARDGINVEMLISAHQNDNGLLPNFIEKIMNSGKNRMSAVHIYETIGLKNHMKLLICDGQILIGSHNLSTDILDRFGTIELSYYANNPNLADQLYQVYHKAKQK